ncbi:MAG: PIN domain-containing protein [Candidatus Hydrothermarchaeaceae archaeon]
MIFADSSYFIAIADRKDQWHERARKLSKNAQKMIATELVLSESVTAVGARGGGKAGMALYEYVSDNCQVTFADMKMLDRAMKIYLMYDATLSLADAVSLVVMEDCDIKNILSFDSDFDKVNGITRLA